MPRAQREPFRSMPSLRRSALPRGNRADGPRASSCRRTNSIFHSRRCICAVSKDTRGVRGVIGLTREEYETAAAARMGVKIFFTRPQPPTVTMLRFLNIITLDTYRLILRAL